MEIRIDVRDDVLKRFGNKLAALGNGQARVIMSRALNHEGDKGRTQVKRALVKQTGMKYGLVTKAVRTIRSTPATLTYEIVARGNETNIGLFAARQTAKGVSAAPWGVRRLFAHAFILGAHKGRQGVKGFQSGDTGVAFVRAGRARLPIKALYGPNLAREILKGESEAAFRASTSTIANRIAHELSRVLKD